MHNREKVRKLELLNIIEIFKMLYVNTVISDDVYLNAVRISSGINGFANVRNVAILLGVDFEVSRVKLSYLMYIGVVDMASCDCGCGSPIFLPEDFTGDPKPIDPRQYFIQGGVK